MFIQWKTDSWHYNDRSISTTILLEGPNGGWYNLEQKSCLRWIISKTTHVTCHMSQYISPLLNYKCTAFQIKEILHFEQIPQNNLFKNILDWIGILPSWCSYAYFTCIFGKSSAETKSNINWYQIQQSQCPFIIE